MSRQTQPRERTANGNTSSLVVFETLDKDGAVDRYAAAASKPEEGMALNPCYMFDC